jgi:hypothetical protein
MFGGRALDIANLLGQLEVLASDGSFAPVCA